MQPLLKEFASLSIVSFYLDFHQPVPGVVKFHSSWSGKKQVYQVYLWFTKYFLKSYKNKDKDKDMDKDKDKDKNSNLF